MANSWDPRRLAAALTLVLTTTLALAVGPVIAATASPAREATASSKVGTYEGTIGKAEYYFSLHVVRSKRGFKMADALAFYTCPDSTTPAFTTFGPTPIRRGRYVKDSVVTIRGSFATRGRTTGRANPAPGFLGCTGKPMPFEAKYVGKRLRVRLGEYAGTDATGAPVTVAVDNGGLVVKDLQATRRVQCGSSSYGSLFGFAPAAVRTDGTAVSTIVDEQDTAFTASMAFTRDGTVTGSYRVVGTGCDTGEVAFSAAR